MKKLLVATLAGLALTTGSAFAADLYRPAPPMYTKAPPPVSVCNWCGFYIGLNAGWVGSASDHITNTGTDTSAGGLGWALGLGFIPSTISVKDNGFIGGGQIGYNWQAGSNIVVGLEADIDDATAKSSATASSPGRGIPFSTTYTRRLDWLSTVRGRLGFTPTPSLLLYGTGGLAIGQVKIGNQFTCAACVPPASTETTTASTTSTMATGWTAGAGIEYMITPHVSLKAEYLYADLGKHNSTIVYTYPTGNTSSLTSSVRDNYNIVRAGIDWHFNTGAPY